MSTPTRILTSTEISYKYAVGHMACTREINHLVKYACKRQREICSKIKGFGHEMKNAPEPDLTLICNPT